jgi:hypothetical protein
MKSHSSNMIKSMKRKEKQATQTHNSPKKPMKYLRWWLKRGGVQKKRGHNGIVCRE